MLGERWKALNDKQRTPYEQKAKQDKERYESEKASYNVSVPALESLHDRSATTNTLRAYRKTMKKRTRSRVLQMNSLLTTWRILGRVEGTANPRLPVVNSRILQAFPSLLKTWIVGSTGTACWQRARWVNDSLRRLHSSYRGPSSLVEVAIIHH